MSFQNNSPVGAIAVAVILGLSAIVCANLVKSGMQNSQSQFEFKQEGPVFLRFNKNKGDICYTGLGPNGKFVTDSWLCMDGDKIKEAEIMINSPFQAGNSENSPNKAGSSNNKKSGSADKKPKKEGK